MCRRLQLQIRKALEMDWLYLILDPVSIPGDVGVELTERLEQLGPTPACR